MLLKRVKSKRYDRISTNWMNTSANLERHGYESIGMEMKYCRSLWSVATSANLEKDRLRSKLYIMIYRIQFHIPTLLLLIISGLLINTFSPKDVFNRNYY